MKLMILFLSFFLIFSCKKDSRKQISVFRVENVENKDTSSSDRSSSTKIAVLISSSENFQAINDKMSFGFVAVEKPEYFELPQEELVKKHVIFEVVDLKLIAPNQYQFFITRTDLARYQSVYCRFERPGFVMKEGYHSPIFKLQLP